MKQICHLFSSSNLSAQFLAKKLTEFILAILKARALYKNKPNVVCPRSKEREFLEKPDAP